MASASSICGPDRPLRPRNSSLFVTNSCRVTGTPPVSLTISSSNTWPDRVENRLSRRLATHYHHGIVLVHRGSQTCQHARLAGVAQFLVKDIKDELLLLFHLGNLVTKVVNLHKAGLL